jgi:hypothetical protein
MTTLVLFMTGAQCGDLALCRSFTYQIFRRSLDSCGGENLPAFSKEQPTFLRTPLNLFAPRSSSLTPMQVRLHITSEVHKLATAFGDGE